MRKYWEFFKIGLQVAFAYPGQIIFRALRHTVIALLFIVLWAALFKTKTDIGGFNFQEIVTYYILVEIIDVIYTASPARILRRDINSGDLNNYLVKPMSYWGYIFSYTVGQQIADSLGSIILVILAFLFLPSYLQLPSQLSYLLPFFVFSTVSLVFYAQIFFNLGVLTFWTSETMQIRQALNQAILILGGRWIPINLFPSVIASILGFLPFQFLFGFPIKIFQQKVSSREIGFALILEFVWLSLFIILGRLLWNRGLRRYEAYGR